jgi:dihydroorotate dehydrogenase (fumarate)
MPIDITTEYLGLKLRSPLVPSASTLADDMDKLKKLEDAGASAVVLHSLFEEQIRRDRDELFERTEQGTESFAEALTYFPEISDGGLAPDERLEQIGKAKKALRRSPSLRASTGVPWGAGRITPKKLRKLAPMRSN